MPEQPAKPHPRALLLFFKLTIIGFGLYFVSGNFWPYIGLYRALFVVAIVSLHPRFRWLVVMTLGGVYLGLASPDRVNWDPTQDYDQIQFCVALGVVAGFIADWVAQRESASTV